MEDIITIKPDFIDYEYQNSSNSIKNSIAIPFDSEAGENYLINSNHKKAFFKLAPHYSPQQHITTCGICSAIIILNAIYTSNNKKPPVDDESAFINSENNSVFANFIWSEGNFFNKNIQEIIDKDILTGKKMINGQYCLGINLDLLTNLLNLQKVKAINHHVNIFDNKSISEFRELIKFITATSQKFMISNYNLNLLSDKFNVGHFSPVAAYHEPSDSVLILDTWAAFTPWYWVKLVDFYKSMHTLDDNIYRGYILVDSNL